MNKGTGEGESPGAGPASGAGLEQLIKQLIIEARPRDISWISFVCGASARSLLASGYVTDRGGLDQAWAAWCRGLRSATTTWHVIGDGAELMVGDMRFDLLQEATLDEIDEALKHALEMLRADAIADDLARGIAWQRSAVRACLEATRLTQFDSSGRHA